MNYKSDSTYNLENIDTIVNENKLVRYASELEHTPDKSRKNHLKTILSRFEKTDDDVTTQNDLFQKMDNTLLHNKKWIKLSKKIQHECIKIYLKNMSIDKNKINEILKLFDEGGIKNSQIEFQNGKIIDMDID